MHDPAAHPAARPARRRQRLPARAAARVQPQVLPGVAPALPLRRAAERPAARRARLPPRRAAARAAGPVGEARPQTRVTLRHGPAADDAEPRAPVGDRAGDGAARLRLLPRGAQADRPAARPLGGGTPRGEAEKSVGSARGQHLRELLDELGPTFVKFGQLLSTRPDVVPPDIIAELRGLQDDVRPFPFEQAERVIEEDLGNSIERLFLDFERSPSPPRRSARCTAPCSRTAGTSQ